MVTASTESLVARIESFLREKAKYAGLELVPPDDSALAEEYGLGEVTNAITFGLRGERGRVWTVTVADPDDGEGE